MKIPVDFHCHGVGNFDFGVPERIDLFRIDDLLKIENVRVVLVLSLPRGKLCEFETLVHRYHSARSTGALSNILGIGIEGPVLAFVGGTPESGCWVPTQAEWERIAALGQYGLIYSVMSPDAEVNLGPGYPQDIIAIAELLARHGVMPAIGHFSKSDPPAAAAMIDRLCQALRALGLGPVITDHLFNDMPLNFKHAWRTQQDKERRAEELAAVLAKGWDRDNMIESLGPVPAAIIRQALNGNLKICLNFDGDHVDIEICKRAIQLIGADHILLMTDRIPGDTFGGHTLARRADNSLLYQGDGIVAGGTQAIVSQLSNMLRAGIESEDIYKIVYENASHVLSGLEASSGRQQAGLAR
jgi:N-acetylglucosamine-6-phosphate deacetylase